MLTQHERQYFKKQFKILPVEPLTWSRLEVIRLLTLLKIVDSINPLINIDSITSNQLINIAYLQSHFEPQITQSTYFPFYKLKAAVYFLCDEEADQGSDFEDLNVDEEEELDIKDEEVLAICESVDKLVETDIIELSVNQIVNILKSSGIQDKNSVIKKMNIDGFALICTLTNYKIKKQIQNLVGAQEVSLLSNLSILFISQYFRQINLKQLALTRKESTELSDTFSNMVESTETTPFAKESENIRELVILSDEHMKKFVEDPTQKNQDQLEQSVIFGESEIMGESEMGQSVYGTSEIAQSQYGQSVRGSYYPGNSEYGCRGSVDCRMSFNVIRTSFLYDDETLNEMIKVSLDLPFDLFNFEALHQLKLRVLDNPYGCSLTSDHLTVHIQGMRFGRDKSNQYSFPDEPSISSKHARILFKNDGFYLQDVGSKFGTFLKIVKTMVIEQETFLQLSHDIELVIRIVKRNRKQGVIKAEVVKPQNSPDYKISLREGYKVEIGKSQKCHIRINNSSLADRHAEIYYQNGDFILKNHNAKNGIWRRLSRKSAKSEPVRIKKGTIFRLCSKKSFYVQEICSELNKSSLGI